MTWLFGFECTWLDYCSSGVDVVSRNHIDHISAI